MMQVFDTDPQGIQTAPHEPRILAAGHQVSVREINLGAAQDKTTLMLAFLNGLGLRSTFGQNWDALYDVLTDPDQRPDRLALLLCDHTHFRRRHPHLNADLERVLLDAQAETARTGRALWLLSEEPDSNTRHW